MDRLEYLRSHSDQHPSIATTLAYGIALIYVIYQVFVYLDYPILSSQELFWNALVYATPKQLLLDRGRGQELRANDMLSQTHAAKSEALRKMLGMGGHTLLQKLPAEGIMRRASGFVRQPDSNAPPGLGNWDNSCYQNSVLQGLASLDSLKMYLRNSGGESDEAPSSTTQSLLETIDKLNDPLNNGKQLWTPAKLKNMSSWQQQDAQEYFSKIMDELDKEAGKALAAAKPKPGLESIAEDTKMHCARLTTPVEPGSDGSDEGADDINVNQRNPLDGLLAQRVACTRCGHSDGLSMIPFNCLTIPLGSSQMNYNLEDCLDEYMKQEEISDVECAKCTLMRAEQQLTQTLPSPPCHQSTTAEPVVNGKVLKLPPELRAQAFKRLRTIQQALENDDFADKTVNETCQIPKKARVSSTKTRQAVIGRAPQSLVVHVNRSVFDEMTGVQRKNYASVRYPLVLDLSCWMLDDNLADDGGEMACPSLLNSSLDNGKVCGFEKLKYRIKAVVTHYGRHENGHYICYRQNPTLSKPESRDTNQDGVEPEDKPDPEESSGSRWWRLSDEDVSTFSEADVLAQGGVFMLFYERESSVTVPEESDKPSTHITEAERAKVTHMQSRSLELEEAIAIPLPPTVETELDIKPEDSHAFMASAEDNFATGSTSSFDDPSNAHLSEATTEDESEPDVEIEQTYQAPQILQKPAAAPFMRTARSRPASRSEHGFGGNAFRTVAAS